MRRAVTVVDIFASGGDGGDRGGEEDEEELIVARLLSNGAENLHGFSFAIYGHIYGKNSHGA
jgi:hypothetical protein